MYANVYAFHYLPIELRLFPFLKEILYLIKTNFLVFTYPHSFCLTADEEIQFQEPDQAWRFQLSKSQIKPGGSNLVCMFAFKYHCEV